MFDQRLQLLVSADQRRRLEAKAKETGKSVGRLIREAIDARYGAISRDDRIRAAKEIGEMKGGRFLTVAQMHEIIGEERFANFPEILRRRRR